METLIVFKNELVFVARLRKGGVFAVQGALKEQKEGKGSPLIQGKMPSKRGAQNRGQAFLPREIKRSLRKREKREHLYLKHLRHDQKRTRKA